MKTLQKKAERHRKYATPQKRILKIDPRKTKNVKGGPEACTETGTKCRAESEDDSSFNSFILLSDKHSVITWQRNVENLECIQYIT